MKKRLIKSLGIIAGIALSLSAFAACNPTTPVTLNYDNSVVKAFRAVTPVDFISQTATAEGQEYLVTVITSSSVSEYHVDSDFNVGTAEVILGDAPVRAGKSL